FAADSRDSLPITPLTDFPISTGTVWEAFRHSSQVGRHNIAMPAGIVVQQPTAHMRVAPWERHSPRLAASNAIRARIAIRVSRQCGSRTCSRIEYRHLE